ncbi:hypothetical protein IAD21_00881 [Abditibacteriota bacterium]|nr:hypothetical protein IAD21_00881 [Abditibacteriota bacterium]
MTREPIKPPVFVELPPTIHTAWIRASYFGGATIAASIALVFTGVFFNAVNGPLWVLIAFTALLLPVMMFMPIRCARYLSEQTFVDNINTGFRAALLGAVFTWCGGLFLLALAGFFLATGQRSKTHQVANDMTDIFLKRSYLPHC